MGKRKIVQITTRPPDYTVALCDDGTVWETHDLMEFWQEIPFLTDVEWREGLNDKEPRATPHNHTQQDTTK